MKEAAISVITVTRNSSNKLAATCESVAAQEGDYEHLIIDGASTDGSREIAAGIAGRDPRVRLISEPDQGIYDAMNKAIRLARGRYLYFLGAGDTVMPGAFAAAMKAMPDHQRAFIYCDVILEGARYDGIFSVRKLIDKNICHQSIFYGRDIFQLKGSYDLRYTSMADWEMNLRCMGCGQIPKIYVNQVIATFEPGGVSKQQDERFHREKQHLIWKHLGLGPALYFFYRRCRRKVLWWRYKYSQQKRARFTG